MDNSQLIIKRAHALKKVRAFFDARQVFEVDTPLLTTFASVDTHIDLVEALPFSKTRYLITSPEYAMKRLLAAGAPDIYQLSHVFRDGEISLKHNPEFMMLEWYRKGFALNDLIEETIALFHQFLPHARVETCTYFQLFMQELGVDPWNDSLEALKDVAQANNIDTGPFNERDDL
jgi:Truncated, possibly inactive, lysyl-tRNA synthetase (class II)